MPEIASLLPFLLLAVLFYVLVMRPAQRRQRDQARVAATLAPGVRVMTSGGLFATVHAVHDGEVELEIAPGTVVRYVTQAVARIVPEQSDDVPGEGSPGREGDGSSAA